MIRTIHVKHALVASSCAALVASAVGFLVAEAQVTPTAPPALATMPATAGISDVAERVVESVVNISSSQSIDDGPAAFDPFFTDPSSPGFGQGFGGDPRMAQSMGSGVIVNASGRILTNAHVIHGADTITVTLHDGTDHKAKVIGTDARADLAVLQLEGKLPPLQPLRFADSTKLRLGEVVLAVGNPFGVGQAVTMGIVSATGRASVGIAAYEDFIQTDAAINPGNSGGALVDTAGNLIGINSTIFSQSGGSLGIGFAIPVSLAKSVLEQIIKDGTVTRGWLGIEPQEVSAEIARAVALESAAGVLIRGVVKNGPAERAGIQPRDVVLELDGKATRDTPALLARIADLPPGSAVKVKVWRDRKAQEVEVTVGRRPQVP